MNQTTLELTDEQRDVVNHEGTVFVTACPGAGKTRVMVERARHLFRTMPLGRGLAFLSFTHAAVSELETRLLREGILPTPVFPSFIGTFDSFVWQFLVAPFGIKDSEVRPLLIADIDHLAVRPFDNAQKLPLGCFHPETGMILEDVARQMGFDLAGKSPALVNAYRSAAKALRASLREQGQLSFQEARTLALERLSEPLIAGRMAAALKGRFREIVIDEAQDCNPEDLSMLSWMLDSGLALKVICDPNQSIYGFRGGVTDDLFRFANTFASDQRLSMTGSFRATPNICKAITQLRAISERGAPDDSLGPLRVDATPVQILSYPGNSVPASIGTTFSKILAAYGIAAASSPIIAATKDSGAAAAGHPRPTSSRRRIVRLAEAVTTFHTAGRFSDMKKSIESVHRIMLEIEGHLDSQSSYYQYLAEIELDPARWRPRVVAVIRALRFESDKYTDARAWHSAAKDVLSSQVDVGSGQSIARQLSWDGGLAAALNVPPSNAVVPRTIHSVKGMEFPAVCVVTTSRTLKDVLDFLTAGEPSDKAEEARKLYVAASRAESLLVIAAPKSQSQRLKAHLAAQGAIVTVQEI